MAEIRLPSVNKVLITGYATRDPELRYTPSGAAVANFGIGSTRRYKDQSGEWKDDTAFINVVAWQRWAELARDNVKKGSPLLIEGRLQSRSWETEDGRKRTVVEIRVDRFQALEKFSSGATGGESSRTFSREEVSPAAASRRTSGDEGAAPAGPDLDDVPF
ncbi:MAG: single-stranded DNA-binding protein [Candidatus Eisenbacteria sp.]|nr:single-stranded DNA-binding protein [Candidatus Eisenbacteria bacterium]